MARIGQKGRIRLEVTNGLKSMTSDCNLLFKKTDFYVKMKVNTGPKWKERMAASANSQKVKTILYTV